MRIEDQGARFYILGNAVSKPDIRDWPKPQIEDKLKHWLDHDLKVNIADGIEVRPQETIIVQPNPKVGEEEQNLDKKIFKGDLSIPSTIVRTQYSERRASSQV